MELLTIKEVASILKIEKFAVYKYAKKGIIPAVKVGRNWRFLEKALEKWLTSKVGKDIIAWHRKKSIWMGGEKVNLKTIYKLLDEWMENYNPSLDKSFIDLIQNAKREYANKFEFQKYTDKLHNVWQEYELKNNSK